LTVFFRNLFDRDANRGNDTTARKRRSRKARKAAFRSAMARRLRLEPLEQRVLLATLTLTDAADSAVYGATAGNANNVIVSFAGTTYTIADTTETIAVAGALANCVVGGSGTNSVTLDCANQADLARLS